MTGVIIKGIGGFYYVKTADGVFQAKGRGKFKKDRFILAVGDRVELQVREDGDSVIESVYPRKNSFIRPPVANVDRFIITVTASKPAPDFGIIDRFLVTAEKAGAEAVICINKIDRADGGILAGLKEVYEPLYPVATVSGRTGQGLEVFKKYIEGCSVAFAGPSGVGKSTIINRLIPGAAMETGRISRKTDRGRHTTRHVELFEAFDGMVFDTPGFTSFDLPDMDERELSEYYPEIFKASEGCRFDDCMHLGEPGCRVKEEVEEGLISPSRYRSYKAGIEELRKRRKY